MSEIRPADKKYILENINKKSSHEIARDLGIKERKIKKFIASHDIQKASPSAATAKHVTGFLPGVQAIDSLNPLLIAIALFAIAFVIKFIVLINFEKSLFANLLVVDMADYDEWAQAISHGRLVGESAFNTFLFYPYFLGSVYFLMGHDLFIVRLIQIVIGSASAVLFFGITKRMFNSVVGLAAFCLMLLFKEFYCYEMALMPTTIAIFFYGVIISMLFSVVRRPQQLKFILLGLVTGAAVLNRAYLLFLLPGIMIVIWLLIDKKPAAKFAYTALFALSSLIAISPASVHNYLLSGDPMPLTSQGGINFYLGNNPAADGMSIKVPFPIGTGNRSLLNGMKKEAEARLSRKLKPSEVSRFWFSQGGEFIAKDPMAFIGRLFNKTNAFLCGFDISDILSPRVLTHYIPLLNIFVLDFRWIIPLALAGIAVTACRKKEFVIMYLIVAGHIVSIVLLIVEERYRLPIAPLFIVFSAGLLLYLYKYITARNAIRCCAVIMAVAVLGIYFNNGGFRKKYELNLSANYVYLGGHFLDKGDPSTAIAFFERAVTSEPKRAEAHNMLGLGYFADNQYDKAMGQYSIALKLNPRLYQAHNNMAIIFEKRGMREKAMLAYRSSLDIDPDQPAIRKIIEEGK